MADKKISGESKDDISRPSMGGDFRFGKLILLRDCLKDVESDASQLRNIIANVDNEIYITNEKIKSLLDANQKRIDLLRDLQSKVSLAEYKRTCYIEEFVDLIPFALLRDYYNGFLNVIPEKINK